MSKALNYRVLLNLRILLLTSLGFKYDVICIINNKHPICYTHIQKTLVVNITIFRLRPVEMKLFTLTSKIVSDRVKTPDLVSGSKYLEGHHLQMLYPTSVLDLITAQSVKVPLLKHMNMKAKNQVKSKSTTVLKPWKTAQNWPHQVTDIFR